MMWSQALVLAVAVAVSRGFPDPCGTENHIELDEKHRSTGYKTEYPETPLCDVSLASGWYRFNSGAGGMMPERCVDRLQCGTVVPVWLNGTHPAVSEGVVSRVACANFNTGSTVTHRCCEHSLTIGVKNCGSFFVYYLKPAPSCPISYCAGDRAPCPAGKFSPTGFAPCKEAFPKISTDPILTGPEIVGNTFRFACNVQYAPSDPDQAFDVTWTFDDKEDPAIPTQEIMDPQRVVYLDGAKLQGHLGQSVGCKIRSRFLSHGNLTSPWLKSNTYWAGIRTSPAHVTISEKQETQNVTLTSTIPILCDHTLECCLTMRVDVDGPKENLVSSHACEYYLCSDAWDETTQEASINIPISATKDQITDGNQDMLLSFDKVLSGGGGPYLQTFDNYKPPNVAVDVRDVETKSCSWTGDPHIHGMNHAGTYHLFKVGDYTMFESPGRDMEIQARTWPCNNGRVTCICGVTIREKNDVIRINECDQPYKGHHTSPHVEVADDLREGTIVQRSTDGHHIAVYLPSGTEVKIDATNYYLNTYLTVPSVDDGEARGICGTFDGVSNNEFTKRDGGVERECSRHDHGCVPERFTESWSNNKQNSLFETLPPKTPDNYEPKYCRCDKDFTGVERINCTAAGDLPRHNLKCSACRMMSGPIPSFLDPTQGWTRRSAVYVDMDEKDPKFDPDMYKNFAVGNPSWPTPSGITQQQAETKCQAALRSTQLGVYCPPNTLLYDVNVIDCVTDILYGDTFDMIESATASFLTECQSKLARDPSNYVTDSHGKSVMKPELSDDVCSVFCQRHGHCVRGKCVCQAGFTGDNCNLLAGKGPQLAKIRSNNTCDVSKRPCRKVFIDATNLENKDTFACRVLQVQAGGSVVTHAEEAEFLSAGRLACHLPSSAGQAVTKLTISATNDGTLFGNEMHVTVFDGTCQSCDQQGHCTLRASTCSINNKCHQDGDANPNDATKICDVSASTSQWTPKPTPAGHYPNIQPPVLSGPDDDFQMECAVTTSATEARARFTVTWFVDGQPTRTETLTPGGLVSFIGVAELPSTGKLTCSARSFFDGEMLFSALVSSKDTKDLGNISGS